MTQPALSPIDYTPAQLQQGANNLLINCAGLKAGERLLLVQETPELGWYDTQAPEAVAAEARQLGADVTTYYVTRVSNETDHTLATLRAEHDVTVFFARAGDQNRFSALLNGQRSVMSYARNAAALASAYGCTPHQAMLALKQAVNRCIFSARQLEIRCPLGTHYTAELPGNLSEEAEDVSVMRFPMGVHAPVSATYGSGRIALAEHLTTTGTHAYQPDHVRIHDTVFADIEAGRIKHFSGAARDTQRVLEHYQRVAGLLNIDPDAVHSWHAGIHGASPHAGMDDANPDYWSNTVFTHPGILHFHTCGDYAPGEICWNIKNAEVTVDGKLLWQAGRLCPENFTALNQVFNSWPELQAINNYPV